MKESLPRAHGAFSRSRRWLWTLLVLAALVAWPERALAKARIVEPVMVLGEDGVRVSFRLEEGFGDDLERRLDSGLPVSLVYRIQLMRDRLRWSDKLAESRELEVVATYDASRREYLVHYKLDGELIESRLLQDASELRAAVSELDGVQVFSTAKLERLAGDRRILVRIRAELGTRTLFFFFPSTITTDWAESAKHHLPGRG